MRPVLAPLVLHGLLLAAGFGVLAVAGRSSTRAPGGLLPRIGLAYLLGLSAVVGVITFLLVVGVPFTLPVTLVVAAGLAVPAVVGVVRGGVGVLGTVHRPTGDRLVWALFILLAIGWLLGLLVQLGHPLNEWDAWAIWTHKASIFINVDHLPKATFASPAFAFAHPDYPIGYPLWEAMHFRALGRLDTSHVAGLDWLLLGAWSLALAAVAPRRTSPALVTAVAVGVAALAGQQLVTGYADIPAAMLLSLAALALARWLEEREPSDLLLAVVLAGGAATFKNEGLMGAGVLFVAAAFASGRAGWRPLAIAAGAWLLLFVAPWRAWLAAADISGDLPLGRVADPAYLLDHADRAQAAMSRFFDLVVAGNLMVLVPIAVIVVATVRGSTPIRRFFAIAGVLYLLALVLVYWVSPHDIVWHLDTSAGRTFGALAILAAAAIIATTATADDEDEDDHEDRTVRQEEASGNSQADAPDRAADPATVTPEVSRYPAPRA